MQAFDLERALAFIKSSGDVCVYPSGDVLSEPELIIGRIDEAGVFLPQLPEYRDLELWLKDQERAFIEEGEMENFDLGVPQERDFLFAYGQDWREIWEWDSNQYTWVRKG